MLKKGIDTVVLGCTHYPFVIPQIQSIVGPHVRVIDPAPAVARQIKRLLEAQHLLNLGPDTGHLNFFTTGDAQAFTNLLPKLLGEDGKVTPLKWIDEKLSIDQQINQQE